MVKRVLIVETVAEVRLLLEEVFAEAVVDYQVTLVPDSFRALDRLLQQPFDLILLDQQVSGIGWLSLAQIVRAVWPDRQLLLMGDDAFWFDREKKPLAFDGFIPKPFSPAQLLKVVAQLTNKNGQELVTS
jgi:CheY-like chemotaxis protein